jgi:phospholipid:diacylglycerol acyltransferase
MADAPDGTCAESDGTDCETPRPPLDLPLSKKSWIDYEFSDLNASPKILNGVKMG